MPDAKTPNQLSDTEVLAKFGYKQDLLRQMGGFSNFAISFSIISILTGLISMFGYGVQLVGGFAFWTWVVVAVFQLFNALTMGEMASSFPLAGGLYPWARHLSSPRVGWWVGWINMIAWWAVSVAIDFSLGTLLAGSHWFGLQPTTWTKVILTLVIMAIQMFMNIFGIKVVSWFNNFSAWVHMIGVVLLFVLLLALGHAQPGLSIFQAQTLNLGDAPGDTTAVALNSPVALLLAFLPAILMSAWTLTAFDASADVSEETKDPQHTVPWGMVIAVVASFFFGSFVLIGLIHALPAVGDITSGMVNAGLASWVITNVMHGFTGIVMLAIIALAQFACSLSSMTVFHRVIWSLARDGNLPFSHQLKKVSQRGAPYMAAVSGTIAMAALITTTAMAASITLTKVLDTVTSIATVGFYFGYLIVIVLALRAKFTNRWTQHGPWTIGKFWVPVAVVAIAWNLYISVAVCLPPNFVTFEIFAGLVIVLAVYYFVFMHRRLSSQVGELSLDELEKLERAKSTL